MKKLLFVAFGFFLLGLGVAGVVLPVLPTTPFVLLAAACFSAGDKRFYIWLRGNRVFGPYIENYHSKMGIPLPLKIASITFLWVCLIVSMYMVDHAWPRVLLGVIGAGVTIHLSLIKTKKQN